MGLPEIETCRGPEAETCEAQEKTPDYTFTSLAVTLKPGSAHCPFCIMRGVLYDL